MRRFICTTAAVAAVAAMALMGGPSAAFAQSPGQDNPGPGQQQPPPPPPPPPPPDPSQIASSQPVAESGAWRDYVLDSPTPEVYPVGVKVVGDPSLVTNPDGLMEPGGGVTYIREGGVLALDLGQNVGGTVDVSVVAGGGGPLSLAYSEARRYLQPLGDTRGVGSLGLNDDPNGRADLVYGPSFFHSPGTRGAERYILMSLNGPGEFGVDFVRVTVRHLRPSTDDYTGHFLSSDKLLNRVWYASAYTQNIDSVRDPRVPKSRFKLVDGAKRDRLLWLGDLAMQALIGEYTVRQMPGIIERSLRSFGCQQLVGGYIPMASDLNVGCGKKPGPADGPPKGTQESFPSLVARDRLPSYTPWFVVAICDRFQFTGDATETRDLLPVMRRTLRYFSSKLSERGLFFTPENAINWRAFDSTYGEDAHTNALWVRAMRRLAIVESEIGDPAEARKDRAMANELAANLRKYLYDRKANLFITNTFDPIRNHPQDANVEAVLAGVLRGKQADQTLRAVRKRLWTKFGPANGESDADPYVLRYISPYMSGWELIARLTRHDGGDALDLMKRLWGRMVKQSPHSTVWEAMGLDGLPVSFKSGFVYNGRTSLAHGWSGAPVVALSGYVSGMRPVDPGWKTWLVEPQTLGLSFAQARVGTPHGSLASRWISKKGKFRLTVEAPGGTSGVVAVPLLGAHRTISRNGQIVWKEGRARNHSRAISDGTYIRIPQAAGTRTYAWSN